MSTEKILGKILTRRGFVRLMAKAGAILSTLPLLRGIARGSVEKKSHTGRATVIDRWGGAMLLKNGLIVDGTGKKGFVGSVLIKGDKIVAVTPAEVKTAGKVIDCTNKVIAPGFIDAHSHADWHLPIVGHPELMSPFTAQGVTTVVAGNCGYAAAGFRKNSPYMKLISDRTLGLFQGPIKINWSTMEEYFTTLRKQWISHNLVDNVGHGMTRTSIRGFDPTPMRSAEMREMLALLGEAMDQGARGVSLGLQYEPGVFATKEELTQVASLVKKKDKILAVHMKAYSALSGTYPLKPFGEAHNLLAIRDMLDIARQTGVRLQLSHLIFVGTKTWGNYEKALAMIDEAIRQGLDVKFDTYSYHCGASHINVFLPEWFLAGVPGIYNDKTAMLKLRLEAKAILWLLGFGFEDIQITYANHPELNKYNGMFLRDIAKERGLS
ncbi:MAG: amidohydrolase family protein, partial [Smithellaceae bacterium]|nr:amidohydrolase family protein [Smithellaceae bacterium]